MKCERLTLVNFCKHRHRVVEIGDGLTAIIGPNGVGKSHIMGGIRFALTGDNPNVGTKTDNICDLAPPTEASYVELAFSHGSTRAVVRRNIRPARPTATLRINDGAEVVEGDTEVTLHIQRILGVTTDILNDIVIVAQEEIFGFLDKKPAARAAQFQRLFGTEYAATLHKVIGDQLKTVEIPAVGVDRDQLLAQLTEADAALTAINTDLGPYPTHDEIQAARNQNVAVVTAYQQLRRVEDELVAARSQRGQCDVARQTSQSRLTVFESERAAVCDSLGQWDQPAEQARAALTNLSITKQQAAARERAVGRVQQLQALVAQTRSQSPPPVPGYIHDIAAAEHELNDINVRYAEHSRLVSTFAKGICECPTCQTPTAALTGRIEASRSAVPSLAARRDELLLAIRASREYDALVAAHAAAVHGADAQLSVAISQLDDTPATTVATCDEAALQATLETQQTFRAGLAEYDQLISNARAEVARWDGQLTQLDRQIAKYESDLSQLPLYTLEQSQQAQANVAQWDITASNRRSLEVQAAAREADALRLRDQLAAADRVLSRATMLRDWHQFAENVRGVFHKDASPRFVAQRNLEHLQFAMNESLEMFDTPFRVTADEGLSFTARFLDGSVQPAERLSGGQKVILALSFRLALNLMFAENIGAIYLDEPTAWLDEHHIRGFEPVLTRLRDYSTARGLQSVIITHERGLAPLFDTVVQL